MGIVKLTRRIIPSTELVRRVLGEPNRVIIAYNVWVNGRVVFASSDLDAAKAVARDLRDRYLDEAAKAVA